MFRFFLSLLFVFVLMASSAIADASSSRTANSDRQVESVAVADKEPFCQQTVGLQEADSSEKQPSVNVERKKEENVAIQKSVADSTAQLVLASWVQAFVAALGAAAVAASLIISAQANRTANRTAEIASRAYVDEHRPWLKLQVEEVGPVSFDGEVFKSSFRAVIENVGGRPAEGVELFAKSYRGHRFIVGMSGLDNVLEWLRFIVSRPEHAGSTLLPGERYSMNFHGSSEIDEAEVEQSRDNDERIRELATSPGAKLAPQSPTLLLWLWRTSRCWGTNRRILGRSFW